MKIILVLAASVLITSCSSNTPAPAPQAVNCMGVWAQCLGDCGDGKGVQHYVVLKSAQNGGAACEAADGQARACTASVCAPPQDPHLVAHDMAELVAKGTAGSFCITVTDSNGKQSQANVPNGFGPCLLVFQHADGMYYDNK